MKCALLQSSPGKLITLSGRGCRWLKISCTEVPPLLRGFGVPPLVDLPFLFYGPPSPNSAVKDREIRSYGSTLPKLLWPCYLLTRARPQEHTHGTHERVCAST